MTNTQNYQAEAIEKLENGELDSYESEFVEKIRDYTKKELRNLTSKQFMFLRQIANQ